MRLFIAAQLSFFLYAASVFSAEILEILDNYDMESTTDMPRGAFLPRLDIEVANIKRDIANLALPEWEITEDYPIFSKVLEHPSTMILMSALNEIDTDNNGYPAIGMIYDHNGHAMTDDLGIKRMKLQRYMVPAMSYALLSQINNKNEEEFLRAWRTAVNLASGAFSPVPLNQDILLEILHNAHAGGKLPRAAIESALGVIMHSVYHAFDRLVGPANVSDNHAQTTINSVWLRRIIFFELARANLLDAEDRCDYLQDKLGRYFQSVGVPAVLDCDLSDENALLLKITVFGPKTIVFSYDGTKLTTRS